MIIKTQVFSNWAHLVSSLVGGSYMKTLPSYQCSAVRCKKKMIVKCSKIKLQRIENYILIETVINL